MAGSAPRIGILALQGAVEPHRNKFAGLEVDAVPVRTEAELQACAGVVIPGGESTTLLKLIDHYELGKPLRQFAARGSLWGVCAGSILMAQTVENPAQASLGIVPVTVRRNAYGRQNESFIAEVTANLPGERTEILDGVFIRAPKIVATTSEMTVLAEHDGVPVSVQHAHHLLTTFHPELSRSDVFHRHFVSLCQSVPARNSAA